MAYRAPDRVRIPRALLRDGGPALADFLTANLCIGIALVIGVPVVREGNLFAAGHGLELILVAGGIGGGIVYTVLALRASRMARNCRRRLRETRQPRRR